MDKRNENLATFCHVKKVFLIRNYSTGNYQGNALVTERLVSKYSGYLKGRHFSFCQGENPRTTCPSKMTSLVIGVGSFLPTLSVDIQAVTVLASKYL